MPEASGAAAARGRVGRGGLHCLTLRGRRPATQQPLHLAAGLPFKDEVLAVFEFLALALCRPLVFSYSCYLVA